MKHQILIASYRKDFEWLGYCLRSLRKYSTGFLPPVVAIDVQDQERAEAMQASAEFKIFNGPGFGRAQAAMMSGDLLCPEADYVWLLGSDCLATRKFSPADYCDDTGRPIILWNSWSHMEKHAREVLFWREGVRAYTGLEPTGEFMRRLPIPYCREVFLKARQVVEGACGAPGEFNAVVFDRVNRRRNFSESNILGEVGYRFFRDRWTWVNIDKGCPPDPNGLPANVRPWPVALPIVQHWSHGGLDRPRDQDGRTPRSVINEALSGRND